MQLPSAEVLRGSARAEPRQGESAARAQRGLDRGLDLGWRADRGLLSAFESELDPARLEQLVRRERSGESAAVGRHPREIDVAADPLLRDRVSHLDAHAHGLFAFRRKPDIGERRLGPGDARLRGAHSDAARGQACGQILSDGALETFREVAGERQRDPAAPAGTAGFLRRGAERPGPEGESEAEGERERTHALRVCTDSPGLRQCSAQRLFTALVWTPPGYSDR